MNKSSLLMLAATGGWVASGSAATVYNESIGGDLSNNSGTPTVLTSGTDTVSGSLNSLGGTDMNDIFVITDLLPGGTAQFDFSFTAGNTVDGIRFVFADPVGGTLFTSPNFFALSGSGTTGDITVPASGQVKITVQNIFTNEGGSPNYTWTVATNDVVPETSVSALAALGALLALRRSRA